MVASFTSRFIAVFAASFVVLTSCDNGSTEDVPSETGSTVASGQPAPETNESTAADAGTDRVFAWVNGAPLDRVDVDEELRRYDALYGAHRTLEPRERALKERMVMEKLVDQELLDQWAAAHPQPSISTSTIDAEIDRQTERRFGSREVLVEHLLRRGTTLEAYRVALGRKLALERLVADHASIPGEDAGNVEARFREVVARPSHEERIRAASLFVRWPEDADRDEVRDAVVVSMTMAESLDDFARRARKLPESWERRLETDAGWFERGAVARDIEKTLFETGPGEPTEVITTPLGLQVLFVRERQKSPSAHFETFEPILEERMADEAAYRRREALVESLREDAVIRWSERWKPK